MGALVELARQVVRKLVGSRAVQLATAGTIGAVGIPGVDIFPGGGGGGNGHRHRRKRALTKSDKEDIGFLAAVLGNTAAGKMAVMIVSTR